jgi:hypothetical protein
MSEVRWRRGAVARAAALALAMIAFGGCAAINSSVTNRDLECQATPDDVCIRVADYAISQLLPEMQRDTTKIVVAPRPCDPEEKAAGDKRCWSVDGEVNLGLAGVFGSWVHEHSDGRLGSHYRSEGSPPDT